MPRATRRRRTAADGEEEEPLGARTPRRVVLEPNPDEQRGKEEKVPRGGRGGGGGVDTTWDIDSYRTHYESEEHWGLKRDFMDAHKERIDEDRLVCLAQVFVNIELLGCKYPDKTMEQVAVLAKGISDDYKESKKDCLKRTFVTASNAAGNKVRGSRN